MHGYIRVSLSGRAQDTIVGPPPGAPEPHQIRASSYRRADSNPSSTRRRNSRVGMTSPPTAPDGRPQSPRPGPLTSPAAESAGTVKISPIRPNGVRVMVPPYISRPSISPSTSRSGGLVVREEDVEDDARLVVHDVAAKVQQPTAIMAAHEVPVGG